MTACMGCGHIQSKCLGCGRVDGPTLAPAGGVVARWNHARSLFLRIQGHGDAGQHALLGDNAAQARSHLGFIQRAAMELAGILDADQAGPQVDARPVDAQRRLGA